MQWSRRWNSGKTRSTELHKHSVQGLDSVCVKISGCPTAFCRDPPSSEETLLTQHTRAERQRMTWSNLYNYLPLELWTIHPHNNVWHAKYNALLLRMDTVNFCLEKQFKNEVTPGGQLAVLAVSLFSWFLLHFSWTLFGSLVCNSRMYLFVLFLLCNNVCAALSDRSL